MVSIEIKVACSERKVLRATEIDPCGLRIVPWIDNRETPLISISLRRNEMVWLSWHTFFGITEEGRSNLRLF